MHPIAFVIGSLTIRWYGIMVVLAIAVGVTAMYFESRRQGINADYVL
ncbi:prolipoprotein diacylglyceryl transferase family protein, partial [Candidatus Cryosericum odellii]